ncbi:MAG: hypothetical protein ACI4OZ_03960 [Akkermansia sp.]
MYIAVLVGHLVALLFAFCGVVNLCYLDFDRSMGVQVFFAQLAVAAWPLAVGTAIYVLVQAAMLVERLVIYTENPPASAEVPKGGKGTAKNGGRAESLQPGPVPAAQVVGRHAAAEPAAKSTGRSAPPALPEMPAEQPEKQPAPAAKPAEPKQEEGPHYFKLN